MPLTPGLGSNLRQMPPPDAVLPDAADIVVEVTDSDADAPVVDGAGNILEIKHGDGSLTVSLDGSPIGSVDGGPKKKLEWFDNLVDEIESGEVSRIAEELLRGIRDDESSRKEWIEDRANGIKLLGLKVEIPGLQGATDGAPVEGMSKVRHPLLLEAVLRFQANARSELLPADGPVKIRDDSNNGNLHQDELATSLQLDLNHYLTAIATEYYPDTDRMLLRLGFGGTSFKKVYYCPLRMRPVSETVDANDLIVNNNATDLKNAARVTHKIEMRPSVVKRMQILGVYRDIELSTPIPQSLNSVSREEKAQQGISPDEANPEDRNRQLYECSCELNIKGFEHEIDGKKSGLEIPYRVTIDASSREVLAIVRNYNEDTQDLPEARTLFVQYVFVPGFGFYPIGLLHILGNTTNAVTAAWREMLDNGMYANFPGFLIAKNGTRQNTNLIRVPPGGGQQIDTQGADIRNAVMPLPYNTQQMGPLMQLTQDMASTGQRVGGTSEMQVGEGRADAPVGTTLALIEQAVIIMNSVHKRLCASQAEEFKLLVECFREHPESFWSRKCKSKMKWDEAKFIQALDNCELVPQADQNTSSNAQRLMKIMALKQLQQANPQLYDPIAIDQAAIRAIGFSNPQQFMAPPQAQQQPPPQLIQMQAEMKNKEKEADAKTLTAQATMLKAQTEAGAKKDESQAEGVAKGGPGSQVDTPVDFINARAKLMDAETRKKALHLHAAESQVEDENRDQDRTAKENEEVMDLVRDILTHPKGSVSEAAKEARSVESDKP